MKLSLQRSPSSDKCTIGQLFVNGIWQCFTLEDVIREQPGVPVEKWKIQNETAIPAGTYKVITDFSQRFQRKMMHVLDVPGFDGIRIHAGNTAADTDGCILVGERRIADQDRIANSQDALYSLGLKVQAALDNGEEVTLEILQPVEGPIS
jgi:hypothetical protein